MSNILFSKTLIIGLGVIGGSFAKSLRLNSLSQIIYGFDLEDSTIADAKAQNIIDNGSTNFDLIDQKFDLIVIASPLETYQKIFDNIGDKLQNNTIIIDLGSLKNFITKIIPAELQNNFIGCHPIAGSEQNGFNNSKSDLFKNKKFIICPTAKNNAKIIKKIEILAQKIGCESQILQAKKHDEIYALISHLPQFLSFLTSEFSPKNISDSFFAQSFRLDNSNSEIWTDIFNLNMTNIENFYLEFFDILQKLVQNPTNLQNISLPKNIKLKSDNENSFDHGFFEENFANIFFRALIVLSYVKIDKIESYQIYSGSGFDDFTSILQILNYDKTKLNNLISKNYNKILKNFKAIS